jgi:hypothetical protein
MDIVVVVGIVAGVVIYAGLLLSNPLGPPVAGPCRLVTRRFLRDYCSGACAPGQACVAIVTRPYLLLGTQAAACACGVVTVAGGATGTVTTPSTSGPGSPGGSEVIGGGSSIAPVTGSSLTGTVTRPDCECSAAQENAEFQRMLTFYTAEVNNARSSGYQAGNDPGVLRPRSWLPPSGQLR